MNRKSCLLLITGAYNTSGGIATVNRIVIRALSELGYTNHIHVLNEPKINGQEENYISFHGNRYYKHSGNKYRFAISAWKELLQIKYTLVIVDHINVASVLLPYRYLHRNSFIVWLFGKEVFSPLPDWQGILGMRGARKLISISDFTTQTVLQRFPNLNIQTCELALEPDRFTDINTSNRIKTSKNRLCEEKFTFAAIDGNMYHLGDRLILYVGRMDVESRHKGQEHLLSAFPYILQKYHDCQLIMVGDGQDRARLISIAASLPQKCHQRIFIPGYLSNDRLSDLYGVCYVFVMPSIGEGFGLVFLEAMAHGKPCIGGKVDATPCLIHENITGLLLDDPHSPKQIADKVIELMDNPERAQKMGEAGYNLVNSHYLFPHFLRRFEQIIMD